MASTRSTRTQLKSADEVLQDAITPHDDESDVTGAERDHHWLELAAARAHQAVVSSSWAEMAKYLQELFGQRLAAAITGVDDARTVGRWIRGQEPQHAQRERLRDAYQVAILIETAESREVARAWFLGMNPDLNDEPPAQVIAEDPWNGGKLVMKAARSFIAS